MATCAAAEAHTGTNCVTVAVSDLAFEEGVMPTVGDVLELRATPIMVGNTSLAVSLLVLAEDRRRGTRVAVCSSHFTYVTTPGADGVRPSCPPLVCTTDEERYAAMLGRERKSIIGKEKNVEREEHLEGQELPPPEGAVPISETVVNMTELVLPAHTNHMNDTFGGEIMAWMHKAAMVSAGRHVSRVKPYARLETRSVAAVDFKSPSKISDHLLFEAAVQRVVPPHHLLVHVHVQKRVISDRSRVETINEGLFHIEAWVDEGEDRRPLEVPPVGPEPGDAGGRAAFEALAWRWELLAARSVMFGFAGGALPWVPSLWAEASRTAIEGILRLLPNAGALRWEPMDLKDGGTTPTVHIARDLWGQEQLAVKLVLPCPNVDGGEAFKMLMDCERRKEWDSWCEEYVKLEDLGEAADLVRLGVQLHGDLWDEGPGGLYGRLVGKAKSAAGIAGEWLGLPSFAPKCSIFTMLRAWRGGQGGGEHVIASRSVRHPRYPAEASTKTMGLPSGWVVRPEEGGGCTITYVLQTSNAFVEKLFGSVEQVEPVVKLQRKSLLRLHRLLDPTASG